VQCPALNQHNLSNIASLNYTGTSYEDIVLYTCIAGYETNVTESIWCQANKTWSSSAGCVREFPMHIYLSKVKSNRHEHSKFNRFLKQSLTLFLYFCCS